MQGRAEPRPRVLKVGLDASQVDYSQLSGVTEHGVREGGLAADRDLEAVGLNVTTCALFKWDVEASLLRAAVRRANFDCVMIGAGLRSVPEHVVLFEKVLEVLRQECSSVPVCFNLGPEDTLAAVRRCLPRVRPTTDLPVNQRSITADSSSRLTMS